MIKREPSQQPALLSPTLTNASNIKVIPANQFIQLKPSGSTQKFITLKSSSKPVVSIIPRTAGGTPISGASQTLQSFSPTKYTIVRNTGAVSNVSTPTTGVPLKTTKSPPTPDLSNTNIFDIPIVFADNEGNIQDGSPQKTTTPQTNIVTIASTIPSQTTSGNRLITLQPSIKPNKVVVINKNNIKQVPGNILANRPATVTPTGVKYAKVVLSNPLTKTTTLPAGTTASVGKILPSGKVEIINSAVVKPAPGGTQKYQPIIINVDPNKTKSFVRVGDTQIRSAGSVTQQPTLAPGLPGTNTILIKTNSLSQLTAAAAATAATGTTMRKPAILNRNLTVRKVNLVPQQQQQQPSTTSITPVTGAGQQQQHQQSKAP